MSELYVPMFHLAGHKHTIGSREVLLLPFGWLELESMVQSSCGVANEDEL